MSQSITLALKIKGDDPCKSSLVQQGLVAQWLKKKKKKKKTACQCRNSVSIPGSGRSPGEGKGNPLQHSCLENPMDRGA